MTAPAGPLEVLEEAVRNVNPALEVKSRRVGGATYQVPSRSRPGAGARSRSAGSCAIARERREKQMSERLADELLDAPARRGAPASGRTTSTGWREANKAFAHYRW